MIKSEIPKYNETFNPILDILKNEFIIHRRELIKKVINKYYTHISKELLEEKIKSGGTIFKSKLNPKKYYLCF